MSIKTEKNLNNREFELKLISEKEVLSAKMSPNKEEAATTNSGSSSTITNSNSINSQNKENCATSSIKNVQQDSNKKCESSSQQHHHHHHHHHQHHQVPAKKSAMDFRFGKIIGEGSYSTVYLAQDVHSLKEYAIKVCEKKHIIKEKKQTYIRREREALHLLNNTPGFVNLYCTFQDDTKLYFVVTYAKNGELLPYINKVGSFDLPCTKFYAAELLLCIEEMHKRNIIHRDLKPENILLNNEMHLMITDFGSSRILPKDFDYDKLQSDFEKQQKEESEKKKNHEDFEAKMHHSRATRKESDLGERKNSFVGTAQYVAPEILKGGLPHWSIDLWALGCIIYQMISGLPPFRGPNDYLIFQQVLNSQYEFPDGFDEDAKDLVEKLLQLDPRKRLGSTDQKECRYNSIRNHKFFDGIDWDKIRTQNPPHICPYLPGNGHDGELRGEYTFNEEPGLGDRQLRRLLEIELGTSNSTGKYNNILNIPESEMKRRLDQQKKENPWIAYVEDDELIVKYGFINKRKGLFSRKRMLLLTTTPRLIYIDAANNVKKGEIPFSVDMSCEPKNFKIFFVHTPNRTYYLEDPEGYALEWCKNIDEIRDKAYEKLN